jgi:hypothetical protein
LSKLIARKRGFFPRSLHLDEFALFGRDQVKIHRHGLVLLVIQIENRDTPKHTGADRSDELSHRR